MSSVKKERFKRGQHVIIMRHGERRDGQPTSQPENDPPLTEAGKKEVEVAAKAIKELFPLAETTVQLISSPFLRARQTAEELQRNGVGVSTEVRIDNTLSEVYGPIRIKTGTAHEFEDPTIVEKGCGQLPLWGETLELASVRYCKSFINAMNAIENKNRLHKDRNKKIVPMLITHGDALSAIMRYIYPNRVVYCADYLSFMVVRSSSGLSNFSLTHSSGIFWLEDGEDNTRSSSQSSLLEDEEEQETMKKEDVNTEANHKDDDEEEQEMMEEDVNTVVRHKDDDEEKIQLKLKCLEAIYDVEEPQSKTAMLKKRIIIKRPPAYPKGNEGCEKRCLPTISEISLQSSLHATDGHQFCRPSAADVYEVGCPTDLRAWLIKCFYWSISFRVVSLVLCTLSRSFLHGTKKSEGTALFLLPVLVVESLWMFFICYSILKNIHSTVFNCIVLGLHDGALRESEESAGPHILYPRNEESALLSTLHSSEVNEVASSALWSSMLWQLTHHWKPILRCALFQLFCIVCFGLLLSISCSKVMVLLRAYSNQFTHPFSAIMMILFVLALMVACFGDVQILGRKTCSDPR